MTIEQAVYAYIFFLFCILGALFYYHIKSWRESETAKKEFLAKLNDGVVRQHLFNSYKSSANKWLR